MCLFERGGPGGHAPRQYSAGIGLEESPQWIWRRARERGGERHALPPPQRLIGRRSHGVRFGKVGWAASCTAAAEDWLSGGSQHFLRGAVAVIQVARPDFGLRSARLGQPRQPGR